MIKIVNLRTYQLNPEKEVLIFIDRRTPIGNPFPMKDESMRDEVCDKYEVYFAQQMLDVNSKFYQYVEHIIQTALRHNVALGCWCAPKRCHGLTIYNYIKSEILKREGKGQDNESETGATLS